VFICAKISLIDESVLVDSSISFAIEVTTLLGREVLLWRAARPAHRRFALLDDLPRVGVTVLVALDSATRIVVPTAQQSVSKSHGSVLPAGRYTEPSGAFV
jgi:hypothetical protein